MNAAAAPSWMPDYLVPFFTLSYPTRSPTNPDSFPNSRYYGTGELDICFVLMWIGFLGIAREVLRLKVFEPFARWWLEAQDQRGKLTANGNGHGNGHAAHGVVKPKPKDKNTMKLAAGKKMTKKEWATHRSVLRFAEQGWPFVYGMIYWSYGIVSRLKVCTCHKALNLAVSSFLTADCAMAA